MKTINIYYPWPKCPSISISGGICALNCEHCNKIYIKHMVSAKSSEKLIKLAIKYENEGAKGLLISGGCDKKGGLLNLEKMLPSIKRIKHETNLIIKLHTGFVDFELAKKIADAGVDIASNEFVGSQETIKQLFHLNLKPQDYVETFVNLQKSGIPFISPHVAVGLHYGKLKGEFNSLDLIKKHINPSTLVIIIFRPTKGSKLGDATPPTHNDIGKVIKYARILFPDKPILLGSLRPRTSDRNDPDHSLRYQIENIALESGIDRMELPSQEIIDTIKMRNIKIKKFETYGVLPEKYEEKVGWEILN